MGLDPLSTTSNESFAEGVGGQSSGKDDEAADVTFSTRQVSLRIMGQSRSARFRAIDCFLDGCKPATVASLHLRHNFRHKLPRHDKHRSGVDLVFFTTLLVRQVMILREPEAFHPSPNSTFQACAVAHKSRLRRTPCSFRPGRPEHVRTKRGELRGFGLASLLMVKLCETS